MAKFAFQDYKSGSIDKSPGQWMQNFTIENEQNSNPVCVGKACIHSIHWTDDTHTVALGLLHYLLLLTKTDTLTTFLNIISPLQYQKLLKDNQCFQSTWMPHFCILCKTIFSWIFLLFFAKILHLPAIALPFFYIFKYQAI